MGNIVPIDQHESRWGAILLAGTYFKVQVGQSALRTNYEPSHAEREFYVAVVDVDFNLVIDKSPSIQKTEISIDHNGQMPFVVSFFVHPNERVSV